MDLKFKGRRRDLIKQLQYKVEHRKCHEGDSNTWI